MNNSTTDRAVMTIKEVAWAIVVVAAFFLLFLLLSGCAAMQSALGIAPSDTQITNCATWIKSEAATKALPSTQLQADMNQLHANPPTIPADCNGHT